MFKSTLYTLKFCVTVCDSVIKYEQNVGITLKKYPQLEILKSQTVVVTTVSGGGKCAVTAFML